MNYPMEKYRFIHTGNKTIAISTYAGKTVRGIAKCDPRDEHNQSLGDSIAALRCAKKVANLRYKRAKKKAFEANKAMMQAQNYFEAMSKYMRDAETAVRDVDKALNTLLAH